MIWNKIANTCKSGSTLLTSCSRAKKTDLSKSRDTFFLNIFWFILDHQFVSMSRLIWRHIRLIRCVIWSFQRQIVTTVPSWHPWLTAPRSALGSAFGFFPKNQGQLTISVELERLLYKPTPRVLCHGHLDPFRSYSVPIQRKSTCFSVVNSSATSLSLQLIASKNSSVAGKIGLSWVGTKRLVRAGHALFGSKGRFSPSKRLTCISSAWLWQPPLCFWRPFRKFND